jgi:hypothetical protein
MPSAWQSPDLDEIRRDRFIVNNEKVHPFLRGEGQREGVFFHLQSWRREGWVARLRMAGFNVRTLEDRVNALPSVRNDLTLGPEGIRRLSSTREQIATWDPKRLRWRELPVITVDGVPALRLHVHEPLRRRKSRSGGDFFIAVAERPGRIGLHPVKETEAIMQAYALLAAAGRPAVLTYRQIGDGYIVMEDQALLPEPHREVLDRLSREAGERWTFDNADVPFVERVFQKLGIALDRQPDRVNQE